MAKFLTSNTDYTVGVNAGKEAVVTGIGTYSNATITVKINDGFGNYKTEPNNGTQTTNFSYVFTAGEGDGIRLSMSGAEGATNVAASVAERPSS